MNLSTIEDTTDAKLSSILPGAPWLIAHRSMLGINKPYKFTLNSRDYVIWQSDSQEVFALDNICPHMQAPLSDGYICSARNTIVCPFHALEFDGEGQLLREGNKGKAIARTMQLIVKGDLIWTYGTHQPKLSIPNLISDITEGYQFLGIAGVKSIQAEFLKCLKINYDFNHAIATHNQPFKFEKIEVNNYRENGYYTSLDQIIQRSLNTRREVMQNPALLTTPKTLHNHFEYAFPATTSIVTQTDFGQLAQFFILYPETKNTTKTFVMLYIKPNNTLDRFLSSLLKKNFLKAFDLVVEQDSRALETLYPQQKPKIRLPREEIMFYAEKLYREWD